MIIWTLVLLQGTFTPLVHAHAGRTQAGYFDPTLLKYKPRTIGKTATEITAPELFKRFTAYQFKEKGLAPGSRRRYEPIQSYLDQWLNVPAHTVSNAIAGNFVGICLERLTAKTAKERVWLLKSCWDWAIGKYHLADENPWTSHIARIKPRFPLIEMKI